MVRKYSDVQTSRHYRGNTHEHIEAAVIQTYPFWMLLPVDCNTLPATGRHHLREGMLGHHFQGFSAAHFVIE